MSTELIGGDEKYGVDRPVTDSGSQSLCSAEKRTGLKTRHHKRGTGATARMKTCRNTGARGAWGRMACVDTGGAKPYEDCLAMAAYASELLNAGDLAQAEKVLAAALMQAREADPADGRVLFPLVVYHLSLLRQKEKRSEEAEKFRKVASAIVDQKICDGARAPLPQLMANVLMNLEEYRRAIPFWDTALEQGYERNTPTAVAEMLWRAGECYSRNGAKDHAALLLRAAAKSFREHSGDPRLSAVLVTLGNALRKSAPAEAEKCYREAAELHEARGQLQSATTAWVNLGVLCSEQGRHEESLGYYQMVLRVREQTPGTPVSRIGTVKNNLANCYRRMGRFAEAHVSVDRAIELLKAGGGSALASAFGTRGLVYRDEGKDEQALEWARRAVTEHQKAPTPSYEAVVENLESEIGALKRLGREDEAARTEEKLQGVRAAMEALPKNENTVGASDDGLGAVLVELSTGSQVEGPAEKRELMDLGHRLGSAVQEEGVGIYASRVAIPESTTLIFYGEDAEKLFEALQPVLRSENRCAGARVTVRQGRTVREAILPGTVM
jgi:tetratricopeptide (TPR) repeat protein